jgi:hypothetical protein
VIPGEDEGEGAILVLRVPFLLRSEGDAASPSLTKTSSLSKSTSPPPAEHTTVMEKGVLPIEKSPVIPAPELTVRMFEVR